MKSVRSQLFLFLRFSLFLKRLCQIGRCGSTTFPHSHRILASQGRRVRRTRRRVCSVSGPSRGPSPLPDPSARTALGLQIWRFGMLASTTKTSLSPARKRLIELLQETNFGRIERLEVRGGEPVLDPLPSIVLEYKFASENGCRPEAKLPDFTLKQQHLDLLRLSDRNGHVATRR